MMAEKSDAMQVTFPSDREIVLTRDFDAPRSLVFEAFTRPEHVKHWWGPRDSTLSVCEVDLRPGGTWRFVVRKPNGKEEPFRGEYREITPPERLVYTFRYDVDGYREPGGLVTDLFQERGGGTTVVETMLFTSVESRDVTVQQGMVKGAAETFDRLAELLATLVKGK
jgi:uncharacterized protein YndB with AHSA1/START domain